MALTSVGAFLFKIDIARAQACANNSGEFQLNMQNYNIR